MFRRLFLSLGFGCALLGTSCGGDFPNGGSGFEPREPSFEPPEFGAWVKYEPEGAVCSDGSQYKFWVEFSETSDNVIIFFQGGGACWDYKSCSGEGGIRGAANPNGLPDDYAEAHEEFLGRAFNVNQVYPLLNDDPAVSPMADWNKVFVPYCTGDIYSGTRTASYPNPDTTKEDLEFRHVGHLNVLKMIEMLDEMFAEVPKMFVGGCSAGGVGALVSYYFLRTGIRGVQKGYLLDDSGPAFPSKEPTSRSLSLYDTIRPAWGLDDVLATVPQSETLRNDFGQLSAVLADEFPNDRLATTLFRLDYNFSLYSYERFYTRVGMEIVPYKGDGLGLDEDVALDRAAFYSLFWDDTALLLDLVKPKKNYGYFLPYYRETNDSHCVTLPGFEEVNFVEALGLLENDFGTLAWLGSEIGEMNLRDYVEHLLNDEEPLESYFEDEGEGRYVPCAPDTFDAEGCEAAVAAKANST